MSAFKFNVSPRILIFVALATALATANTYGSTLAAALFLNRAGAEAIPVYYIFYAALSIPLSVIFARVIDRWPRPVLFTGLLIGGAVVMAGVAVGARFESMALMYALYILISVFEQTSYSIFYVLMADYFTSVEINRSTTGISVGMALGGLFGGALAGLGAGVFSIANLLFGMPALLAGTLGVFFVLRRRTVPLGEGEAQDEEGLLQSLKSFSPLVARYPIVSLIALGVFLNIVVQSVIEYQVFVIYTAKFPDENALTGFLGVLNGVLNALNIVTSTLLTGPLLARIGVARMNLVYPAMTVTAFGALGVSFSLPSAVFSHVVYDPWAHSVDAPIFVSNYNAVPHRFVGRTRIFNDGLVYPIAMAATGAALWLFQDHISQSVVTFAGLLLALGFLFCGLAIRRAYPKGLLNMLRAGALELGHGGTQELQVPEDDIRRLLASSDTKNQSLGLELAARGDLGQFQREIEELLARGDAAVRTVFLRCIEGRLTDEMAATLMGLLSAEDAAVRAVAIEALMSPTYTLDDALLCQLIRDPAAVVAGIAAMAIYRQRAPSAAEAEAFTRFIGGPERYRIRALRVIRRCADPALFPLLVRIHAVASFAVLPEVLEAAADLGPAAPPETERWAHDALAELDTAYGPLRRAACRLLGARADNSAIPTLAATLGDPLKEVRMAAATALGGFGDAALPALREALEGEDLREAAAIEAAGGIGGPATEELLYTHINARHFAAVRRNTKRLGMLPRVKGENDPWAPIATALTDMNRHALSAALAALGALGHRRTVQNMRGILSGGQERSRANAVETIASLGNRRFVQPLLPMLESGLDAAQNRRGLSTPEELERVVENAMTDANRWLRAGGVLTAARLDMPITLSGDADPIVQDAINSARLNAIQEAIMSRLVFLKTVPLFEGLSLDDLLSVDEALGHDAYLTGETIVRHGDAGTTLFIIARGSASVLLGDGKEVAQLGEGEFFGEMALFDDQPRSATVVALTDATLLTLDRDRFSTLVLQRPEILLHICKMFGQRLRETNRRLMAA